MRWPVITVIERAAQVSDAWDASQLGRWYLGGFVIRINDVFACGRYRHDYGSRTRAKSLRTLRGPLTRFV